MTKLQVLVPIFTVLACCDGLASLLPSYMLARNWESVCQHLRNPDLYDATWANSAMLNKKIDRLSTSRDIHRADIISLFPVQSVYLRKYKQTRKSAQLKESSSIRYYSLPRFDPSLYRDCGLTGNDTVTIGADNKLLNEGWLGHLADHVSRRGSPEEENCLIVPLIGAAPLCALVACRQIPKGSRLTEGILNAGSSLPLEVLAKYASEIAELRSFTTMAHPILPDVPTTGPRTYHRINMDYEGLEYLNTEPSILQIDDFLTQRECDELVARAKPVLRPCLVKNADSGAVESLEYTRTSTDANIRQRDVPVVVSKICALLNCHENQLETLQVIKYNRGQLFSPHTDGYEGPATACGFEHSGRLVTLFCYLNTMPKGSGGETRFTASNLKIAPLTGRAVLHFPNSVDLREDLKTEHESLPVIEDDVEKWLLVTWAWKHPRSDPRYSEILIPPTTV